MQSVNNQILKKSKIIICGGHLAPAIAVIENLIKDNSFKIYYFGRKKALEGDKAISFEFQTISKLNLDFINIITGRFSRKINIISLLSLVKMPLGFFQSAYFLIKIRPQIILSFGGYLAIPICITGWLLRIPIITHEQTSILGLANKIICRISRVLCISNSDTKNIPSKISFVLTGNPIRESLLKMKNKSQNKFLQKLPLIYITGGSSGSRSINNIVSKIIPQLAKEFRIIHQCGDADDGADFIKLNRIKNSLNSNFRKNYQIYKHIDLDRVGQILSESYLIISRSGINTVSEIAYFGIPSILIPLPWSADNEQIENAKILEKINLSLIIDQYNLNPNLLRSKINYIHNNYQKFLISGKMSEQLINQKATENIIWVIKSLVC